MGSPKEKTFRDFTQKQGANYSAARGDYHPYLYQTIIDQHTSTGGQLGTLVDLGCGPGTAVRALAPFFTHAVGLDPSEGMISSARALGGLTQSSEPIRFEVSSAEDIGSSGIDHHHPPPIIIPDASVDLITAAAAAHWFDMPSFWRRAEQVLRPGGSVAIWAGGGGGFRVSPDMPHAAEVQAVLDKLRETLDPYYAPGNRLTDGLYVDLPLPWTVSDPVRGGFDLSSFFRKEWGTGAAGAAPSDRFYSDQQRPPATPEMLEMVLSTTSPVVRWREAHPEDAGTERDVARVARRELEEVFRRAGVEQPIMQGGMRGVLLMVKRRA